MHIIPVGQCFQGVPVYQTEGVVKLSSEGDDKQKEVNAALQRFLKYDWGDTVAEDVIINNRHLKVFEEIVAVYNIPSGGTTIFIVADGNGKEYYAITIFLPGEY